MGDVDLLKIFVQGMEKWTSIDKDLCGLVDRLRATGYCHTLEVELRFTKTLDDSGIWCFANIFPEFKEKGIVTIVDVVHGNRILYSSTHNR